MRNLTTLEFASVTGGVVGMTDGQGARTGQLDRGGALTMIIDMVFKGAEALSKSDQNKGQDGGQIADTPAA